MRKTDFVIKTCSLKRADAHLAGGGCCDKFRAVLSIGLPDGREHCTRRAAKTLHLDFYDNYGDKPNRPGPDVANVSQIINFSRGLVSGDKVLVHCKRGRCRSTAAAIVMYAACGWTEDEACRKVFSQSPRARPNDKLLEVADLLLHTKLLETAVAKYQTKRHKVDGGKVDLRAK